MGVCASIRVIVVLIVIGARLRFKVGPGRVVDVCAIRIEIAAIGGGEGLRRRSALPVIISIIIRVVGPIIVMILLRVRLVLHWLALGRLIGHLRVTAVGRLQHHRGRNNGGRHTWLDGRN